MASIWPRRRRPPFPPNSRYAGVGTATLTTADGRNVAYLLRRFVPPPGQFAVIVEHVVGDGERLDVIAYNAFGDPELFWRLCDANNALDPDESSDARPPPARHHARGGAGGARWLSRSTSPC